MLRRPIESATQSGHQRLDFAVMHNSTANDRFLRKRGLFDTRRERLAALALQYRVPAIYQFREYAVAGGLMSYGTSITEMYRLVVLYVGRILKGEKPADLPVVQVTKFELVINLKTAKALGVKISDNLCRSPTR